MAEAQSASFPVSQPKHQSYITPPNSHEAQYPPQNPYAPQYPQQQYLSQQPQHLLQSHNPQPQPPSAIVDQSTSSTPAQYSPTTPPNILSLPLNARHGRNVPLFVPAALRPTERAPRSSPITPPRSTHGSTDSLDRPDSRPISRRSTDKSKQKNTTLAQVSGAASPTVSPDLDNSPIPTSNLSAITGPPTRSHWKPDVEASVCDAPVCSKLFGLFERRHHCRHCGNIFCGEHSIWTVPLNQDANYHPLGPQLRACGHCWAEYGRWLEEQAEEATRGREDGGAQKTQSRPIERVSSQQGDKRSSFAQSLTGTWNWSTF